MKHPKTFLENKNSGEFQKPEVIGNFRISLPPPSVNSPTIASPPAGGMAFSKNLGSANSTSKGRWRSGEVDDAVLKYVDLVVDMYCRC